MAHGLSIGGTAAGLQELMKAGAPAKVGPALPNAGGQTFAAQMKAMQRDESAAKPADQSRIGAGLDDPGTLRDAAKSAPAKKKQQAADEMTSPPDPTVKASETLSLAVTPVVPAPVPLAHGMLSAALQGAKVPVVAGGGGKLAASRGHEGQLPAAPASSTAGAMAPNRVAADVAPGLVSAPVGVALGAPASKAAAGSNATTAGALLPVTVVSISGTVGSGRPNEGGHRASGGTGGDFHEETQGAGAAGAATDAGYGEARTLVSTPNVLEVGITGGAHGWLRVRAELEHTGEVTASLVASSAASAESLHKELGAMSAYLKSEVVGVTSLAVTAPEKTGAMPGLASQANSSGADANGSGGAGQRSSGKNGNGGAQPIFWGGTGSSDAGQGVPPALLGAGVGGWLNVRV